MTDEILAQAKRLGELIKAHERCRKLRAASAAFQADDAAQKLREEYDASVTVLNKALAEGRALEPDDKRKEADLRAQVARNPQIQALLRAQADFHELMQRVQDALQEALDL